MVESARGTEASSNLGKWAPSLYFVVGQAGWFACVLGAAHGLPWAGAALASVLVAVHVLRVPRPVQELKFVAGVTVVGAAWESALVHFGLLAYPGGVSVAGLAPYWIVAVWALFAAQFNTTYAWLKPHPVLAAVLGAVAGPLSFRAGAGLGALSFARPGAAVSALALGWAAFLPGMIVLSRRWDGVRPAGAGRARVSRGVPQHGIRRDE